MSGWLIETLVATTLLMLAVLVLREPVARRFGAAAAYALWLAPALRMVLPPLPAHWLIRRDVAVEIVIGDVPASLHTLPGESVTHWPMIALIVWLSGATLFLGWHMWSYSRFVTRARNAADWLYAEDRIEVAASAAVTSPVAFGIFSKTVMLPADFGARYDAVEQRLALAHEVAHHRRHDLPANLVALAVLALHWFNPVAHWAFRAFRIDQEAACDAQILAATDPQHRHAYGTALYKSATAGTPLAACAMGAATTLKARLSRIVARGDAPASRIGLGVAGAGIFGLVALTASTAIVATPPKLVPSDPVIVMKTGTIEIDAPVPLTVRARITRTAPRAKRIAVVAPDAPEAPVAPMPADESALAALPLPPAPPAVAIIKAAHVSCAQGHPTQFLSSQTSSDGTSRQHVRIMICNAAGLGKALSGEAQMKVIESLKSARADIARDLVIDPQMRQRLLASLDRHIAQSGLAGDPVPPSLGQVPLQ